MTGIVHPTTVVVCVPIPAEQLGQVKLKDQLRVTQDPMAEL